MSVSADFVAALDDLLQAGAAATASLRTAIGSDPANAPLQGVVQSAADSINNILGTPRTEAVIPSMAQAASTAVSQLIAVARQVGASDLVASLTAHLESAKAAGVGAFPWVWVLGLVAAAAGGYYLWKSQKKTQIANFEAPESVDTRPQLMGMRKSLSRFASHRSSGCRGPKRRALGGGEGRARMGGAEKYEFEPEIRLEGMNRTNKKSFTRRTR
jgi:hypothetical protein